MSVCVNYVPTIEHAFLSDGVYYLVNAMLLQYEHGRPPTYSIEQRLLQDIGQLGSHQVFVDIGHGIGNLCLQAAYTLGCEARGIEVMDARNNCGEAYRRNFEEQHRIMSERDLKVNGRPGALEYSAVVVVA